MFLTSYELDNRFSAFDGSDNRRQSAQNLRDQSSIVGVANPNPQDGGAIVTSCAENRKVSIFGDQNRRS